MERKKFIKSLSLLAFATPLFLYRCAKDDRFAGLVDDIIIDDSCILTPRETAGPFPTKDPTAYQRTDIRKGDNLGVEMLALIQIVDVNRNCAPLAGAFVDIWHCDVDGNYSQYGTSSLQAGDFRSVNWYRGRQVTDPEGLVSFQTIFPGWYPGRSTHIHVHIYDATGRSLLVTQIAFQDSLSVDVNENALSYGYKKGIANYTVNRRDSIFGADIDLQMSTVSGSISAGFEMEIALKVSA